MLAGLSPTWYTYLEQGRDIRPSPEVMDSLAKALCLSEDERRYLHTLTYGHVARPLPLYGDLAADELLRQVVASHEDSPYPVFATSHRCDLMAWNTAATEWYDDWGSLPPAERHLVRWLFTAPAARLRLVDWESEAREAVAEWRAEAAKWPGEPALERRVAELIRLSPQFEQWWNEQIVTEHRTRTRRFTCPASGVRAFRLVPVQSPEFAPAGVVLHLPM